LKKKFYQTSEFRKLQNEWYDKLEDDGFEDLEWRNDVYNDKPSPFLKSSTSYTIGRIRQKYTPELAHHYQLCQNFLAHGPFYANLRSKYLELRENGTIKAYKYAKATIYSPNFADFCKQYQPHYTKAQQYLFEFYLQGLTIRDISKELRRLYKLNKLPKLNRGRPGTPYSMYWVKSHLDTLKRHSVLFNAVHPEGLPISFEEQHCQDPYEYLDDIDLSSLAQPEQADTDHPPTRVDLKKPDKP
jgi:hypothetical protein